MTRASEASGDACHRGMPGRLWTGWVLALFWVAGAVFLGLWNLDDWYLWQDEAQAALLSRQILDYGVPYIFDGKNVIWPHLSDVSPTRHVYILWGWLPLYGNALVFSLFGMSTWSARILSAALGTVFSFLVYGILRREGIHRGGALISALLVLFCLPLIWHFRQCGYYAMAVVFTFLFAWSAMHWESGWCWKAAGIFASLALLNTQLLIWGVVCVALLLWKTLQTRRWKPWVVYGGWLFITAVPFLANYEVWRLLERTGPQQGVSGGLLDPSGWIFYLSCWDRVLPWPYTLLVLALYGVYRREFSAPEKKWLDLALVLIGCHFVLMPILTRYQFFRYIIVTLPFLCLFAGLVHGRLHSKHPAAGLCLWIFLLGCGVLGYHPLRMETSGLPAYLRSLLISQMDFNESLAVFLAEHGREHETVLCNYGDFPLMFYTPLRVRGGPGAIGIVQDRIFPEQGVPPLRQADWVVFRKYWRHLYGEFMADMVEAGDYEAILLPIQESPWGNRPSPFHHYDAFPRTGEPFVLFRRKRGEQQELPDPAGGGDSP